MSIYVMSDLHGMCYQYLEMLQKINFKSTDMLYILGDVIDRGEWGIDILLDIMEQPNIKLILGNHENLMVDSILLKSKRDLADWSHNGGDVTKLSFYREKPKIQSKIIEYLLATPLQIQSLVVSNVEYHLVHGYPMEERLYPDYEKILWGRIRKDECFPNGKIVIFGHTLTEHYQSCKPMKIYYGTQIIGVDCGIAFGGRLACLRLDDMMEFYVT